MCVRPVARTTIAAGHEGWKRDRLDANVHGPLRPDKASESPRRSPSTPRARPARTTSRAPRTPPRTEPARCPPTTWSPTRPDSGARGAWTVPAVSRRCAVWIRPHHRPAAEDSRGEREGPVPGGCDGYHGFQDDFDLHIRFSGAGDRHRAVLWRDPTGPATRLRVDGARSVPGPLWTRTGTGSTADSGWCRRRARTAVPSGRTGRGR